MKHNLKYFEKFFAEPTSFTNREFHRKIEQWVKYMKAHKDEFNYLEDDEWKERRERIIAEIGRREDIKEELKSFLERFEIYHGKKDVVKIKLHRDWLVFMRKNQFEYEFTDEQINESEAKVENLARSVNACEVAKEKLRLAEIDERESLEKLSDDIFELYERTGKRPVLTALQFKKRNTGN